MPGQHFVHGPYQSHREFLPPATYGVLLDNVVRGCVDVVLVDPENRVLSCKRVGGGSAANEWWIVGGAMVPGLSFAEAAAHNLERELGLTVDPSRFELLGPYSFVWPRRSQAPQDHGVHDAAIMMMLRVSREEVAAITPNPEDFSEVRWMRLKEVLSHPPELLHSYVEIVRDVARFLGL